MNNKSIKIKKLTFVLLILIISFLCGAEENDSSLTKYYVGETSRYLFCLNNELKAIWKLRKKLSNSLYLIQHGYLIQIDSNQYNIINIKDGSLLYNKTLSSIPNGFTSFGVDSISVGSHGKEESLPMFPPQFFDKYSYAQMNPDRYEEARFVASSIPHDSLEKGWQLIHLKEFIALIDGNSNLIWKKDIIIPKKGNLISVLGYPYNETIIYAKDKELFALDLKSGHVLNNLALTEEIVSVSSGKGIIRALIKSGEWIKVDKELLNFKNKSKHK